MQHRVCEKPLELTELSEEIEGNFWSSIQFLKIKCKYTCNKYVCMDRFHAFGERNYLEAETQFFLKCEEESQFFRGERERDSWVDSGAKKSRERERERIELKRGCGQLL